MDLYENFYGELLLRVPGSFPITFEDTIQISDFSVKKSP